MDEDHLDDLEYRVSEIEARLEMGRAKRSRRRERRSHRKERKASARKWRYGYRIAGRMILFIVTYPILVAFFWKLGVPMPWIHGLSPLITLAAYFLIEPFVERLVRKNFFRGARPERASGDERPNPAAASAPETEHIHGS
jgi:hypothetical protein